LPDLLVAGKYRVTGNAHTFCNISRTHSAARATELYFHGSISDSAMDRKETARLRAPSNLSTTARREKHQREINREINLHRVIH
jgi:hypothetical protein